MTFWGPYTTDRVSALFTVDVSGGDPTPQVWFDSPDFDRFSDVSPDGNWIAWETNVQRHEIHVSRLQKDADPYAVSTAGGCQPRWSKDGQTLFFADAERAWIMAVDLRPDEIPPFSTARRVFPVPEGTINTQFLAYDTLPEGRFLFAIAETRQRHRLVQNWLAEVDRKLDAADSSP